MVNSRRNINPGERGLIELLTEHGSSFEQTARYYSLCADDADDALQRSYEIFLLRYERLEQETVVGWLKTVIKHEALAIRERRAKTVSHQDPDFDLQEARHLVAVEEHALNREDLSISTEALAMIKPHEREALALQAQGYSYKQISEVKNWSYTKVNRCITEGRSSLMRKREALDCGSYCNEVSGMIELHSRGDLEPSVFKQMRRHMRHCSGCRAQFRHSRAHGRSFAGLLPLPLFGLVRVPFFNSFNEASQRLVGRYPLFFEQASSTKVAAVAASVTVAIGGGLAIEGFEHGHRGQLAAGALAREVANSKQTQQVADNTVLSQRFVSSDSKPKVHSNSSKKHKKTRTQDVSPSSKSKSEPNRSYENEPGAGSSKPKVQSHPAAGVGLAPGMAQPSGNRKSQVGGMP